MHEFIVIIIIKNAVFLFKKRGKAFNPKIKSKRKWFNISCEHPKKGFPGFVFTLGPVKVGGGPYSSKVLPLGLFTLPQKLLQNRKLNYKMRKSFQKISKFSVLFFLEKFRHFWTQKKGEIFGKFDFSSVKFLLIFLFLGFKFSQNFDIKKWK